MRPAAERFDANDHLAALVDDGLIQKPQAVVLDRLAQIGFEKLAARKVGIHGRVIDACPITAFVLGAIECHIGIAHDVGCGTALLSTIAIPSEAPIIMFWPLMM